MSERKRVIRWSRVWEFSKAVVYNTIVMYGLWWLHNYSPLAAAAGAGLVVTSCLLVYKHTVGEMLYCIDVLNENDRRIADHINRSAEQNTLTDYALMQVKDDGRKH